MFNVFLIANSNQENYNDTQRIIFHVFFMFTGPILLLYVWKRSLCSVYVCLFMYRAQTQPDAIDNDLNYAIFEPELEYSPRTYFLIKCE